MRFLLWTVFFWSAVATPASVLNCAVRVAAEHVVSVKKAHVVGDYIKVHFDQPVRNRDGVLLLTDPRYSLEERPISLLATPETSYDAPTSYLLIEHTSAAPEALVEYLEGRRVPIELHAKRTLHQAVIRSMRINPTPEPGMLPLEFELNDELPFTPRGSFRMVLHTLTRETPTGPAKMHVHFIRKTAVRGLTTTLFDEAEGITPQQLKHFAPGTTVFFENVYPRGPWESVANPFPE